MIKYKLHYVLLVLTGLTIVSCGNDKKEEIKIVKAVENSLTADKQSLIDKIKKAIAQC